MSSVNTLYLWTGYDTKHQKISVEERDGVLVIVVDEEPVYAEAPSKVAVAPDPGEVIPLTREFAEFALAAAYKRRARFVQNLATIGKVPAGAIHHNEQDIAALKDMWTTLPSAVVQPEFTQEHTDIRARSHFCEGKMGDGI